MGKNIMKTTRADKKGEKERKARGKSNNTMFHKINPNPTW
jgi:hypothetical protein